MALEGSAGSEGDHRGDRPRTGTHDRSHFAGVFGVSHHVRAHRAVVRLVPAMLGALRLAHGQPLAEDGSQLERGCGVDGHRNYHIVAGGTRQTVSRWGPANQQGRYEVGTTHRQATCLGGSRLGRDHDRRLLQDNVVALMGSVTSAQCLAESPIAKQNKIITIDATCNSWQLTMESDVVSPYWVSIVPNTYMEGTAAGRLAASLNVGKIFIVSPKYLFGISETNAFVAALKKANSSVQIVNDPSTWYVPFPTNPRWDSTINAIQAAKPDLVYSNIFAADQINFVKQALAVDPQFFVKYPMTTLVSVDELTTLGSQYPLGMHAYMRAPFFALQNNNPRLTDFITRYRAKYNNEYPSDWAVMDYDAFMLWAQAANAAKSFDADKVVTQISGHQLQANESGAAPTLRDGRAGQCGLPVHRGGGAVPGVRRPARHQHGARVALHGRRVRDCGHRQQARPGPLEGSSKSLSSGAFMGGSTWSSCWGPTP